MSHGEREVSSREGEKLAEVCMNFVASHGIIVCVANSNLVPFLWRPVQDQGIMLYKLTKSWHGK